MSAGLRTFPIVAVGACAPAGVGARGSRPRVRSTNSRTRLGHRRRIHRRHRILGERSSLRNGHRGVGILGAAIIGAAVGYR